MANSNKWLCIYAVAQLGRPYKMGDSGAFRKSTQKTLKQHNHQYSSKAYDNPNYNQEVKTHDCSGLIVGALRCTSVNGKFKKKSPVAHGASSQFKACKNQHTSMSGFDHIPGRLVFIKNTKKDKNKYPYSHVGIYVGTIKDNNGTHKDVVVEAMGRDYGVVFSKLSKWDAWGQLKCCSEDTTKDMVFSSSGSSGGGGGSGGNAVTLKVSAIDPYIASIGPIKTNFDYSVLKKNKVAAMMFNAGSLFDIQHKKKTYKNPFLDEQVKKCEEQNMPFALYADVKAHNVVEADAECRALYYILDLHPPKLGIWLKMDTGQSVGTNDAIIEVYYKYIEKWGLKSRCGIYIDISKLSTISWDKFQDRFYLWGIDKKIDFKTVEKKLLQPSMFEVK